MSGYPVQLLLTYPVLFLSLVDFERGFRNINGRTILALVHLVTLLKSEQYIWPSLHLKERKIYKSEKRERFH